MFSMIRRWYTISQQKPLRAVFALMITASAGVSLVGLTALASDDIVTLTATPTPASTPLIQLSPGAGEPGTLVTITGMGWQPGDIVFVRLGGPSTDQGTESSLASAAVTDDGRFTATFIIPSDTVGDSLSRVLVTAWSPTTGDEFFTVFLVSTADQTPTPPAPTATPTSMPTQPAPTPTQSPPTLTPVVQPTSTPVPVITGWRGEYYSNRNLVGAPALVRDDAAISFDWSTAAPAMGLPSDGFSARWARTLSLQAGTYRFHVHSDDGVRVWLDGDLIIDQWHSASGTTYTAERTLSAAAHTLRVEYYEGGGEAKIQFWWERLGDFPQWRGEYFSNVALVGTPALVRNDAAVDFNWRRGAPAVGLPAESSRPAGRASCHSRAGDTASTRSWTMACDCTWTTRW